MPVVEDDSWIYWYVVEARQFPASLTRQSRKFDAEQFHAAEAAVAFLGDVVSDSSHRTLTSLETPGSCIVTP